MTDEFDYYAILGVSRQATEETIRDAFSGLLSQFPADVSLQDNTAYQQILHAFNVLSDPSRRDTYDALLMETAVSQLKVNVQASRDQIKASSGVQLLYLLIDILPPAVDAASQRPLNLSLVIDRSTSMKGERLDHVKAALEILINKLAPGDIISIISFSDRAEVVVPSGPITNKQALLFKIRSIYTTGGTEIYQGLVAGMREIHQVPLHEYINHLILLTDGHTYGDADRCQQLAQEAARQSVDFSAFGIGAEWNDKFLDQLVSPSSGQSQYIESPTQIIDYLRKRVIGLGDVYARHLRLSVTFPKNIVARYGFKLSPFPQPLTISDGQIKLGNIEGRRPLSFLLELSIETQPQEKRITIPLHFTANLPPEQEYTFKHQYQIVVEEEVAKSPPPPAIIEAVRLLTLYQINEKALDDVEAGDLEAATRRMRHLTTRLLEAGQTKLAQQAYTEGERLATMGTLSLEGRKKLKYGTRALLAQTLADLDRETT